MRQTKHKSTKYSDVSNESGGFIRPICNRLEALLFAADRPLSESDLQCILISIVGELTISQINTALSELSTIYDQNCGIQLIHVAGGWQFRTNPEYGDLVRRMFQYRPPRLTQAALECLSAIAYRQPVTRAEIDALRGVDSSGVLRGLLERGLVIPVGRHESPGRPYLYGTSTEFLEYFGLKDLSELPMLADDLPNYEVKAETPVVDNTTANQQVEQLGEVDTMEPIEDDDGKER
jgi:segregation and condensation protein B